MNFVKKIMALKHILLLDVILLAACVGLGAQLKRQWVSTAEQDEVSRIVPPRVAMKNAAEKQKTPEALEKNYLVIATRNLFSPDRSDQIVQAAAKVRPPKPILYGVLNLKDVQVALMSTPDNRESHSYKVGDKIGEYTLTKIAFNKVQLRWGDESVETTTEDQPKTIAAPSTPTLAGNTGGKVVSVNSGGSPESAGEGTSTGRPAGIPITQGTCKGRWVKTLFGMSCVEDSK
ncbi:MAG: hypothetical protein PHX83_16755 [Acidobacteriia bacterium]|nr:hypothetical protein [Terriglobia bacterium]